MLACPFCGAAEADRFDLEGRRFVVFACTFTPEVDPALSDEALAESLESAYRRGSSDGYFRSMCDRLHLYVTKGDGGRVLRAASAGPPADDAGGAPAP